MEANYEFLCVPFSYVNSPMQLQKALQFVVSSLPNVKVYVDDLLVFCRNSTTITRLPFSCFKRLNEFNFRLNMDKSKIGVSEDLRDLKSPKNLNELRQFTGLVSHYSIAISDLYKYQSVLNALTRKNAQFHWIQNLEKRFRHIIQLIMHHTLLHIYNPKYKLVLSTDASEHSMGGCLQQINPVTCQRETIAHFAKLQHRHNKDALSRLIQRTKAESDADEELVITETLTNFSKEQIAGETLNDPVFKEALTAIQQNFKSLSISKELQWFRQESDVATSLTRKVSGSDSSWSS
uniref:Reverse transcriptase domain-containing protein n=1 Tax=Strongyloides venezuelensis TaxID=75913 RepID=A0A0K0FBA9_STRVS